MVNVPFPEQNSHADLLTTLAQQLVFESSLLVKLNAIEPIINALDPDQAKAVGAPAFKTWLSKLTQDTKFMRQLKIYTTIISNVETSIEYVGQDYLTHPEYQFDEAFEKKLSRINKTINEFTGKLIRELNKEQVIEFG